jgi:quinol monooxygenase YgiN
MITKIAEFTVKPEGLQEAQAAIREFVAAVNTNEPDTLRYEAWQRSDNAFIHFMQFKDEAAEQLHTKTEHVQKFVAVLYPLCEQQPVFTDLKTV